VDSTAERRMRYRVTRRIMSYSSLINTSAPTYEYGAMRGVLRGEGPTACNRMSDLVRIFSSTSIDFA